MGAVTATRICWKDVRLLYLRELRSALRERNIVVNSVLVPVFLYPIIMWVGYTLAAFVGGQNAGLPSRVMIKDVPSAHRALLGLLTAEKHIVVTEARDPLAALRDGALDVVVELQPLAEAGDSLPQNARVRLTYDKSKGRSATARQRVADVIGRYRRIALDSVGRERGLTPADLQGLWVEEANASSSRDMGRFVLGLILPLFLVLMLGLGALHPAIETTAGEREHATWETLMTTATARVNIVVAKYLYVSTLSATAGLLNLAAMTLSLRSVLAPLLGERVSSVSFQIPLASIPVILLGALLLALFISAGMMILGSFARTFKEGQAMASPFFVMLILPINFLMSPGMELTPRLALIPVVNVAMMFREAIAGTYRWPLIALTTAVEASSIVLALWVATRVLRHEDMVLGSYGGGFGRFVKERLLGPSGGGRHG
jgi:sodium transport system permease protein